MLAEHKVKGMFTAPTALRAIKKEDPDGLLRAKVSSARVVLGVGLGCSTRVVLGGGPGRAAPGEGQ